MYWLSSMCHASTHIIWYYNFKIIDLVQTLKFSSMHLMDFFTLNPIIRQEEPNMATLYNLGLKPIILPHMEIAVKFLWRSAFMKLNCLNPCFEVFITLHLWSTSLPWILSRSTYDEKVWLIVIISSTRNFNTNSLQQTIMFWNEKLFLKW